MQPLTPGALAAALAELPGWTHRDASLQRTWRFASFRAALAFMQAAVADIEALDHHPEWTNRYDRVSVRLTTHDAGDLVTALDVALAHLLDRHAQRVI